MTERKNICGICGYDDLAEPMYSKWRPSFEICPCCGIEFGYGDATRSHEILREEWISVVGMKWWDSNRKPEGWNPNRQLANLLLLEQQSRRPIK